MAEKKLMAALKFKATELINALKKHNDKKKPRILFKIRYEQKRKAIT